MVSGKSFHIPSTASRFCNESSQRSSLASLTQNPNRKAMPDADFAKWTKPEDIARVIFFLCSDDAKLIHGAAVPVYGDSWKVSLPLSHACKISACSFP